MKSYKNSLKYFLVLFSLHQVVSPRILHNLTMWRKECNKADMVWCYRTCHFCITFDFEDESYICYAFWVPYEVYIKDFSKFHHFTLVLSSWWFSIHLLELKIQMWRIPPCHTSKVASWHVDYWYELHLWSSLSKIWLKVSKSGKNWQYSR